MKKWADKSLLNKTKNTLLGNMFAFAKSANNSINVQILFPVKLNKPKTGLSSSEYFGGISRDDMIW